MKLIIVIIIIITTTTTTIRVIQTTTSCRCQCPNIFSTQCSSTENSRKCEISPLVGKDFTWKWFFNTERPQHLSMILQELAAWIFVKRRTLLTGQIQGWAVWTHSCLCPWLYAFQVSPEGKGQPGTGKNTIYEYLIITGSREKKR